VTQTAQNAVAIPAKPLVRYFVSYAHEDEALAGDLLRRLCHCLGAAADYRFSRWQDRDIILGADWHEAIQHAIRECDFGLLLVNSAFLASDYIRNEELPHYVVPDGVTLSPGKRAAPVALQRVAFDKTMDLRGLEHRQIFLDSDRKAYAERGGQRGDALEMLLDWARNPNGEPYCAVEVPLRAAEAIRLVREQGAVVIFDGLDEVLVRLTAASGQHFVHELFRILPPNLVHPDPRKPPPPGRLGRVLLTCRTHYFRTVRDRKTFLTAEDRDRVKADDYRVLILLPFEESQIRAYLAQTLPGTDPDRVLETIRAVHNLSELASRPYTLSLITGLLPRIEQWKLEGRRVSGTDLYREMVLSWLERDTGKHQLTPDHKQCLMEQLAAAFWCSGRRDWQVGEVEQWLVDLFRSRPDFAAHYEGKDREVLKEDLRTATFLVDIGEDRFRFAHTSLLEFFLAAFLLRALREGRPEAWDMPAPSDETLDFLGEMLAGERGDTALATMRAMLAAYRPRVSERLLAYLLRAAARGHPAVQAGGMRLDGADLHDWTIAGASASARFVLRGANLRGAMLVGATVRHVDLGGADLHGADLTRAEILESGARGACFEDGNLTGTVFRQVDLREARFRGARRYRTQFLCCEADGSDLFPAVAPSIFAALCRPDSLLPPTRPDGPARLGVFAGHDGTVRLWDAASGAAIAALRGHEGWVFSVAFDPSGARLASAGEDGTVRLWDATTGAALLVRHHFANGAWAAIEPAGNRVLHTGGEAWRWLGWNALGPDGTLTRYPAEIFGPLPGPGS
jgi:uncharacterized protein YjbI with pentapeptide repeats